MTEADDAAKTPENALANVAYQVLRGETHGVLGMYERAALRLGHSYDRIERVEEMARSELKRLGRADIESHDVAAEMARRIAAQVATEVVVLHPSGRLERAPYPTSLEGWQALVGGMIEQIHCLADDSILLVDEEGLHKGTPFNRAASLLAGKPLVGPAVHLTGAALAAWKADK